MTKVSLPLVSSNRVGSVSRYKTRGISQLGFGRSRTNSVFAVSLIAMLSVAFSMQPAGASPTAVGLGTASAYSVLAGTTVTNTGSSTLSGDLGLSPGTAITGFPPGSAAGATHAADAAAAQAQSDLTTAYLNAAGQPSTSSVTALTNGTTLTPGVYTASSSLSVAGVITLDAGGNADAVFIFQAGSTLTTGSSSSIVLTNGAQACNVFWQVGSSATLGNSTAFVGTIMALTSATLTNGATVSGRVLARNGAVTLDNNVINVPSCIAPTTTTTASGGTTTTSASGSTTTVPNGAPGTGEGGTAGGSWTWLWIVLAVLAVAGGTAGVVRYRRHQG